MEYGVNTVDSDVPPSEFESLSFDDWKTLFEENPEQFELYRKSALDYQIEVSDESSKKRLRGLVFQMECASTKATSAMDYNLRLNAMMMNAFDELSQQLKAFCDNDVESFKTPKEERQSATITSLAERRQENVNPKS